MSAPQVGSLPRPRKSGSGSADGVTAQGNPAGAFQKTGPFKFARLPPRPVHTGDISKKSPLHAYASRHAWASYAMLMPEGNRIAMLRGVTSGKNVRSSAGRSVEATISAF